MALSGSWGSSAASARDRSRDGAERSQDHRIQFLLVLNCRESPTGDDKAGKGSPEQFEAILPIL